MHNNGLGLNRMAKDEDIANPRRRFLTKAVNVAELKGLEIGALNKPLVRKKDIHSGGKIFYLDHLSTNELRTKYHDDKSVPVNEIVTVDFVCKHGDMVKATRGETFDYVVASHVIEHAPNLLGFLSDIHKILKPGGCCILIVPDKRFTFDVNRPVTTFGSALRRFMSNENKPNPGSVYDHFAMATHASGHNIWHGIKDEADRNYLYQKLLHGKQRIVFTGKQIILMFT